MLNLTSNERPDDFEYFNNLSCDKRVFFDGEKVLRKISVDRAITETGLEMSIDSLFMTLGYGDLYIGDRSKFGGGETSRDLILESLAKELGPNRIYMMQKNEW